MQNFDEIDPFVARPAPASPPASVAGSSSASYFDEIDPFTQPEPAKPAAPQKDYSHAGDFEAGVSAGVHNMKAMWNGFLAATGQAVGSEDLKAYGLRGMEVAEAEAQLYQQGRASQVEDIDGVGSFLDYAQYTLGSLAPFALESALSAIAGAAVGSSAPGAGTVVGGAGGFLLKKQVKDALRNYAKKQVRDSAEEALAKQTLARVGATAGALVGGYPLHVGDAYKETVEAGDPNAAAAFGAAVPMAALDAVMPASVAGRLVGGTQGRFGLRAAKGAAKDAITEGATELGQEEILLQLRGSLDPEFDLAGEEANSRRLNAGVAGMLGGGTTGAVSGAIAGDRSSQIPVDDAAGDASQFDPLADAVSEVVDGNVEAAQAAESEPQRMGLRGVLERMGRTWNEAPVHDQTVVPAPTGLRRVLADKPAAMREARERRLQGEIERSAIPYQPAEIAQPETKRVLPAQPDNAIDYQRPEPTDRTEELAGNLQRQITENQNAYGRAARSGRLPEGLRDGRLLRVSFRNELQNMAASLVKGGDVSYVRDENDQIVGRTPSVNPDWFKAMSEDSELSMSTDDVKNAVDKALKAERLGVRQARVVGAMLDNMTGRREEYARKLQAQRDSVRAARRLAQETSPIDAETLGYDPATEAGEVYQEPDYLAEAAYADRAIAEMADDAVNAGASYDDVAQLIENKSTVAAIDGLQRLILRMRNEHRATIQQQQAARAGTADAARSGDREAAAGSLEAEAADTASEAGTAPAAEAGAINEGAVAEADQSPVNDADLAAVDVEPEAETVSQAVSKEPEKIDTTPDPVDAVDMREPSLTDTDSGDAKKLEDFGEKIGGARKDTAKSGFKRAARDPDAEQDDSPAWRKRYTVNFSTVRTVRGTEEGWAIIDNQVKRGDNRLTRRMFPTQEEAEKALPLAVLGVKHRASPFARDNWGITRQVTDRKRVTLKDGFATEEDAKRYMVDHAVELIETKTSFGEEILAKPDAPERQGGAERSQNATPEMFMETFGFRGVEFGNWNNSLERQEVLNNAYDALVDLADILGVPPRVLSLNGDLGLGFGSRGHGLSGARAHYERQYATINLTKMKGAGSLAHEWFHALDHYMGRYDGKAEAEMRENDKGERVFHTEGRSDYISHGTSYKSKMRAEVVEAVRSLFRSLGEKAVEYKDDVEKVDDWLNRAKQELETNIDQIRSELKEQKDPKYWKRFNKPATAEQLAEFEVQAAKLMNGEAADVDWRLAPGSKGGRVSLGSYVYSNDAIDAISAIYKKVRGRSGFNEKRGAMDRLSNSLQTVKLRQDAVNKVDETKSRAVPTDYLRDARDIDRGRASDYWSTPHELGARAFSAYVEDKLQESDRKNEFLSYGSDNSFYLLLGKKPFPEGAERKAFFGAFEKFFETLETRETEKGTGFFSKRSPGDKAERAPWGDFPDVVRHADLGALQKEPEYQAAKKGDERAALALVRRVISDDAVERLRALIGDRKPVIQPVLAVEASGNNKIPLMFAQVLAHRLGLSVGSEIYQAQKVGRTDSGADHRLAYSPVYTGTVQSGQDYLIVDDTLTMGGTLASLRGYIQNRGGNVIAASVVTAHPGAVKLPVSEKLLNKIRNKHGEALENYWKSEFGYGIDQLTQGEAGHIGKAADVESIRTRIVAARHEGVERLGGGRTQKAGAPQLEPSGGMTVEAVESAIAKRVLQFKNRNITVRVVPDADSLPDSAQYLMEDRGDEVAPRGYFHPDPESPAVYLVASSLDSADEAVAVLEHEAVGHLAMEAMLGADFKPFIERVSWLYKHGDKTIRAAARMIEADYGADWKNLDEHERGAEIVAKLAEMRLQGAEFSKAVRDMWIKVVQWLRQQLESLGFSRSFTDNDVAYALLKADSYLRTSEVAGLGVVGKGHFSKAATARKALLNDADSGMPIDRAFRKAFDVFGLVKEDGTFKPPAKAKELAAAIGETGGELYQKMPWMHPFMEAAKRGLIDQYGLSDEYRQAKRRMGNDKRIMLMEGNTFLEGLKEKGVKDHQEAKILHAVLTGKDVGREDLKNLAEPIRVAIDAMGQQAVDLGLISEESYQRNVGSYLHRSYLKHETDKGGLTRWASQAANKRRYKIIGNQLKGRGFNIDATDEKLGGLKGAKKVRVFYGPNGREKFAAENAASPGEGWVDRGVFEVRRNDKGQVVGVWRDWTEAERVGMGEIVDARYAIAKTYQLMANDLATGRFYKAIADNADWCKDKLDDGDTEATRTGRFGALMDEGDWVQVPDTKIPKSGAKRWGPLAGKYVRAEIWRDLNETDTMNRPTFWKTLMTAWKLNKTARNPVVHLNNIMSNLMFMDLADVRWRDLRRGIQSLRDKDADYEDALKHGAFGSGFVDHELRRNKLEEILAEIEKQATNKQGFWESNLPQRIKMMGRILDTIWEGKPVTYLGKERKVGIKPADQWMLDAYQVEDEAFRMAVYLRRRGLGDDAETAALVANEQFLNYEISAPLINMARQTVLPFIAYTYRAVPVLAKSLAERPWKIAKYMVVAEAINALGYALAPGDEDEERRALREDQQGRTWFGVPRMLRMPWKDEHGDPVFLDIRRWVVAGDIFDTNVGQAAIPIPAPIQWSGPLMLAAELMLNKQAFTGKEIVNHETDTGWDKTRKVSDWAWKSWMPGAAWIPNSYYWDKIETAAEGGLDGAGRAYSVPLALASSMGIKLQPHNVELQRSYQEMSFDRAERSLKYELAALKRERQRNRISDSEYQQDVFHVQKKLRVLQQTRREVLHGTGE